MAAIGGKHVVQQPRREQFLNDIPVELEPAFLLVDLVIQPHLRRLAHAENQLAQPRSLPAPRLPRGPACLA